MKQGVRPYLFILSTIFFIIGCTSETIKEEILVGNSNADMVKELKAIAEKKDNIQIWHLNKERAMAIDNQIQSITDPGQRISMLYKSGIEWLNSGDYEKSIHRLSSILTYIKDNRLNIPPQALHSIKEVLGISYLRKAEIQNCIQNHNEYSCLIPIEKGGQHVNREGAEQALEVFRELLNEKDPSLQVIWLYNITQMTLGGYPSNIEKEFLLDPSIFDSEIDFPRFTDIAMSLGLGVNDISGSVVMEDFNNDNYLDLLVSSYGLDDQLYYFQNNRKGGFEDLTNEAGLTGLWSGLNLVQADYNNDGWVDVLVLRGAWLGKDGNHPNSLLRNNGDGTFTDVTRASGLYCLFPTQTASWADFNKDGWIDLFIGNEYSQNTNAASQLFKNNGDGTFTDVSQEKGMALKSFIKACIWGDYNNDGYPDLYASSITGDNYLMKNGGPSSDYKFTNVAKEANVNNPQFSFPCWFFDYNQDGWEDIFVSGFDFKQFETAAGEVAKDYLGQKVDAEKPRLYKNNKDGTFSDVSKEANVDKVLYTMGCNFGELNNDGFPDFYAATGTPDFRALVPNRMFLNSDKGRFFDVTTSGGFGHLQKGHGVAFGDIDMDGDQDVYNVLGGSYDGDNFMNALFENPGFENYWVKIKLLGTQSNRSAIGARVKIIASNAKGIQRTFYSTVNSGGSFGANPLLIEQGLGAFNSIDHIEITWPSQSKIQKLESIEAGKFYLIEEGNPNPKQIDFTPVKMEKHKHIH
jgi:hypothetical protein